MDTIHRQKCFFPDTFLKDFQLRALKKKDGGRLLQTNDASNYSDQCLPSRAVTLPLQMDTHRLRDYEWLHWGTLTTQYTPALRGGEEGRRGLADVRGNNAGRTVGSK